MPLWLSAGWSSRSTSSRYGLGERQVADGDGVPGRAQRRVGAHRCRSRPGRRPPASGAAARPSPARRTGTYFTMLFRPRASEHPVADGLGLVDGLPQQRVLALGEAARQVGQRRSPLDQRLGPHGLGVGGVGLLDGQVGPRHGLLRVVAQHVDLGERRPGSSPAPRPAAAARSAPRSRPPAATARRCGRSRGSSRASRREAADCASGSPSGRASALPALGVRAWPRRAGRPATRPGPRPPAARRRRAPRAARSRASTRAWWVEPRLEVVVDPLAGQGHAARRTRPAPAAWWASWARSAQPAPAAWPAPRRGAAAAPARGAGPRRRRAPARGGS